MAASISEIQLIPARLIPSLAKNGIGRPAGISPMVNLVSIFMNRDMIVMTIKATKVAGIFLVIFGNNSIIKIEQIPRTNACQTKPSAAISGYRVIISTTRTGDFKPIKG